MLGHSCLASQYGSPSAHGRMSASKGSAECFGIIFHGEL